MRPALLPPVGWRQRALPVCVWHLCVTRAGGQPSQAAHPGLPAHLLGRRGGGGPPAAAGASPCAPAVRRGAL